MMPMAMHQASVDYLEAINIDFLPDTMQTKFISDNQFG